MIKFSIMYIFKTLTKTVRILTLAATAICVTSCAEEVFDRPIGGIDTSDGQISVLYEVEGDIPLTRGIAATEHEMKLKDVYILFFDNDSDPNKFGKFAGYTRTTASDPSALRFDTPESVLDDHDYRLLVVGNADEYTENGIDRLSSRLDAMLATAEKTYDITEVHKDLLAYSETEVTSTEPGVLPMSGRFVSQSSDQELIFRISRSPEGVTIPENCIFRFQRAICRIDIHNLVGDVLDIKYVRLVNTRDHGAYFFDGLNQGQFHEVTFTTNGVNPAYIEMPEPASLENGQPSKLQRLEAEMYCFPNIRNTCLPNDTETTAIMIAGYYIEPDTHVKDTELTYYRFNLSNAGDSQTLQRNFCYRATIKGVRQRGYETEDKAYNATSPIFTYDISEEWDTDDDNVVTDKDGNFLVVNKSLLTFSGDQCGADVVKLTVNVSDNMTWKLEMADEETKRWFQAEPIKGAESETIKAFTCGPREENHTQYYREGLLTIVATNTKTGSELRKDVRLVQLTTSGDVKCLIVNDYMSDFVQEVSKNGQTISYKIVTGNPTNRWTATDVDGKQEQWKDKIGFNGGGTNGNYFTITFPANIYEERFIDIKFEFKSDDETYNGEIKPITVRFHQEKCDQPLTIEGWPTDGILELNCFDTNTGWQQANCVAQARKFTVHLSRDDEHHYEVYSTFDKYRDLTLSYYDGSYLHGHEVKSIHPGLGSLDTGGKNYLDDVTNENNYCNKLTNQNSDSGFYINAFRMGPGDSPIEGTITVQVKDKNDQNVPNGRLDMTVKLVVPSDEYMLNDVMIKNDVKKNHASAEKDNWTNEDNGWIYIMDRNIGCDPRMHTDDSGNTYANKAMFSYRPEAEYTDAMKITNMEISQKWLGFLPLEFNTGFNHGASYTPEKVQAWKNELKRSSHLGHMYKNADDFPWTPFSAYSLTAIRKNMAVSKGRYFILADEELCPTNNKGKKIRVACWLPIGFHTIYGTIHLQNNFGDNAIVLNSKSKLNYIDFWPNEYGSTGFVGASSTCQLIRLQYLIGYDPSESTNAPSLPTDSIEPQLKYYKEHILKCYEQ